MPLPMVAGDQPPGVMGTIGLITCAKRRQQQPWAIGSPTAAAVEREMEGRASTDGEARRQKPSSGCLRTAHSTFATFARAGDGRCATWAACQWLAARLMCGSRAARRGGDEVHRHRRTLLGPPRSLDALPLEYRRHQRGFMAEVGSLALAALYGIGEVADWPAPEMLRIGRRTTTKRLVRLFPLLASRTTCCRWRRCGKTAARCRSRPADRPGR